MGAKTPVVYLGDSIQMGPVMHPLDLRSAGNVVALDGDFADLSVGHLGEEVRERNANLVAFAAGLLEQVEQRHQQQPDDDPKRQILAEITHDPRPALRTAAFAPPCMFPKYTR